MIIIHANVHGKGSFEWNTRKFGDLRYMYIYIVCQLMQWGLGPFYSTFLLYSSCSHHLLHDSGYTAW